MTVGCDQRARIGLSNHRNDERKRSRSQIGDLLDNGLADRAAWPATLQTPQGVDVEDEQHDGQRAKADVLTGLEIVTEAHRTSGQPRQRAKQQYEMGAKGIEEPIHRRERIYDALPQRLAEAELVSVFGRAHV